MSDKHFRLFVYGTLKIGEENYSRYCQVKAVETLEAIAFGTLYHLPMGYPAMTAGCSPVYGYLFTFADLSVLRQLDWLEDYDPTRPSVVNEYSRDEIEVFSLEQQPLGLAWSYRMKVEQAVQRGGIIVPDGNWTGQTIQTIQPIG